MATPILKNDYQIKIEIDKLNKELEIFKKVILANQLITSKTELNTIEQIDKFLLNGTDFKNAEAVAELKGVKEEYLYLKNNLNAFNKDNYTNTFEIKDSVLNTIYETNTDYLTDEAEAVNRKLIKVIDIFNGINRNYTKALNSDYNGVWTINLLLLQQITNEINNKGRI
jgi:hypothetical protein